MKFYDPFPFVVVVVVLLEQTHPEYQYLCYLQGLCDYSAFHLIIISILQHISAHYLYINDQEVP